MFIMIKPVWWYIKASLLTLTLLSVGWSSLSAPLNIPIIIEYNFYIAQWQKMCSFAMFEFFFQIDDDNQQLYFPQDHVKDTEVTR